MNIIYQDEQRTVVDDREFITPEQAFDILWNGHSVMLCDFDDLTADPPEFHTPFPVFLNDVLSADTLKDMNKLTDDKIREEVYESLRGYEISK